MKLANLRDKEKILKAVQDKRSIIFKGRKFRLATDISTETWQARKGWYDISRVLKENNIQPRILDLARLSFKTEREKKASSTNKLK